MKFEQQVFSLSNPSTDFIADLVIKESFALRFARVTKEKFLETLHKHNLDINATIDVLIHDFDKQTWHYYLLFIVFEEW